MPWGSDTHSMTQWKQSRRGTQATLLLQRGYILLSTAMEGLLFPGTHSFCLASLLAGWDRAAWDLSREVKGVQELRFLSISRSCRAVKLVPCTSCDVRLWGSQAEGGSLCLLKTAFSCSFPCQIVLQQRNMLLLCRAVYFFLINCFPFYSPYFVTLIFPAIDFTAESPDCL